MPSGGIWVDAHKRWEDKAELDHEVKGEDWGMGLYSSQSRDVGEQERRCLIQTVIRSQASQDDRQMRLEQRKVVGILQVHMCQEYKFSKCGIARKRSNVITQPVCDSLKHGSVGSFENVKVEKSTNAPSTSFSLVFHSGSIAEFITNVGYKASNVLWAKHVRKQSALASRAVLSNEKRASFRVVRIGSVAEADPTYDAGRQLCDIGKVVREVIEELINEGRHGVENCLTLAWLRTRDQGQDIFSEIVK